MALPTFPDALALFIAGLTDDDFLNGGHRTVFIPTAQGTLTFAEYCRLVGLQVLALAEQVSTDADSAAAGSGTESLVADIRAGTSAQYLSIRRIYEANVPATVAFATPLAWDMAAGINFTCTLTANTTLPNPTNPVPGKSGFLDVIQGGAGSFEITAYGSEYVWIGPQPVWPATAGARAKLAYFVGADGKVELAFAGASE